MKKISIIFGTRPEAIKLAPVILELKLNPDFFDINICVTAQHRQMLDQILEVFKIKPNVDLNLMKPNQTLVSLTSEAAVGIDNYLNREKPDLILVQGDTTTVFAASLAAFYNKIKIGHVEAGLRTKDKYSPYPEEINRTLTSHLADIHFAPTNLSKQNLLREGISEKKIFITGNTVIDSLLMAKNIVRDKNVVIPSVPLSLIKSNKDIVLITGHRRENFGDGFQSICKAISQLALEFEDIVFIYPVHLNPNVQKPVFEILGGKSNILLIDPLSYLPFVALMDRAKIILTDSGGVQEEAPSLGKPVLVMRENTERPEAVAVGTVKLVGTNQDSITENVKKLLTDKSEYNKMGNAVNPYGDGLASKRIVNILKNLAY